MRQYGPVLIIPPLPQKAGECSISYEMQNNDITGFFRQNLSNSLFISGWAGYACLFPCLSDRSRFILPFSSDRAARVDFCLQQEWDMIIAWSLGAHMCLKNIHKARTKRLVLVAPFLDFCANTSRERILKMISSMAGNPETTVRWFWKLCGIKNPPRTILKDIEALEAGLNFLIHSQIDPCKIKSNLPITLIHGIRDKIVPAGVSEEILECLPHASCFFLPYGHYIPEEEIIKVIYD